MVDTVKDVMSDPWVRRLRVLLSRLPCASLVAFMMCVFGIVLFSACLYEAVEYLITRFEIDIVGKIVWLIMIIHIVLATFFLAVATLSTGQTRRQICAQCLACNLVGRCCQIIKSYYLGNDLLMTHMLQPESIFNLHGKANFNRPAQIKTIVYTAVSCVIALWCIVIAYIFHLIWLILPTVLLIPVALLTALVILCQFMPECISLSDFGIPPSYVDKINPDDIISTLKKLNSTEVEKYISQAEGIVEGAITAAEKSPMLENIFSTIERNVPTEEQMDKYVNQIVDKIDVDKITNVIDQVQSGIDSAADNLDRALDQISDKAADDIDLSGLVDGLNKGEETHNSSGTQDPGSVTPRNQSDRTNGTAYKFPEIDVDRDENVKTMEGISDLNDTLSRGRRQEESTEFLPDPSIDDLTKDLDIDVLPLDKSTDLYKKLNSTKGELEGIKGEILKIKEALRREISGTETAIKNAVSAADEMVKDASSKAETELKAAEVEAQNIISNVRVKGNKTMEDAKMKAGDLITEAAKAADKAKEKLVTAQEQAKQLMDDAKSKGADELAKAKEVGARLVNIAKERVNDTQEKLEEIKGEAEEILNQAKAIVQTEVRGTITDANRILEEVQNRTRDKIESAKERAEETINKAKSMAENKVAEAKEYAEQAMQTAREHADVFKEEAIKRANELRERVKDMSGEAKEKAMRISESLQNRALRIKNDIDLTKERLIAKTKDASREIKEFSKNAMNDVKAKTAELIKHNIEEITRFKDKAFRFSRKAEAAMKEIVEEVQKIADKADLIAKIAAKEAAEALKKAEEAAKAVALEVDKKARLIAKKAEAEARRAADVAHRAATIALQRAKDAARNAKTVLTAASRGATKVVLEAAKKVKHYAKEVTKVARVAAKEAAKGARKAAEMFEVARVEIIKGYEMFMMFADKLEIERKGQDKFCAGAKETYCREILRAYIYMIIVFIASIIINLSMVHFLMAMSANYVHVKREMMAARRRAQEKDRDIDDGGEPSELSQLAISYNMSESGSFNMCVSDM